MREKIYKARFFNNDSGVEITLDEAQSISETDGKPIKILFHLILSELMLVEGLIKGNTFTTLDGYSILVKTCLSITYRKDYDAIFIYTSMHNLHSRIEYKVFWT